MVSNQVGKYLLAALAGALISAGLTLDICKKEARQAYKEAGIARVAVGDFNSDGNSNDVAYVQNDGKTNVWIYTPISRTDASRYGSLGKSSVDAKDSWTPLEKVQFDQERDLTQRHINEAKALEDKFKDVRAKVAGALQ